MLDLNQPATTATGQLTRLVFKRKGDDEGGLIWDADITFAATSPKSLLAIDSVIKGAAQLIDQAEENGKRYTLVDKTERPDYRCTITGGEGDPLVDDVIAEVRFTRLVISGRTAASTVRIRIGGTASQRTDLVANLGEDIEVKLVAQQQALPLPFERKVQGGDIVSLASGHAGVAQSVSDKELTVMDLDGVHRTAPIGDVRSVMKVTGAGEDGVAPMIATYRQRCTRKKLKASWRDLVSALGERYAAGKGPKADGWPIDNDVLDIAIKKADKIPQDVPKSADAAV